MSESNHLSTAMPDRAHQDGEVQIDLADQLLMQRLEIDLLRRQFLGLPIERILEGFVTTEGLDIHLARYRFAAKYLTGSLLDMASGAGHGSNLLASSSPSNSVLGIDIDPETVRYAQLRYPCDRLRFQVGDACSASVSERFDGIASFETIEHVSHPDRMLENIVGMLKPDGSFVVSTPVRFSGKLVDKPRWQFHEREWSLDEFRDLLLQYFDEVRVFGQQWEPRRAYGPIRVGRKLSRALARLSGVSDSLIDRLPYDVMDFEAVSNISINPNPFCIVCVCKGGHRPGDAAQVRRLAYGS